jgi:predicted phage terminase large subunit-like protein
MDYGKLSTSILWAIEQKPEDIGAYEDLFSLCQAWAEADFQRAHRVNKQLRDMCSHQMNRAPMSKMERFYGQWRRSLLFEAPYDFDSYLLYAEINRQAKKRFYQPRRAKLKPVVDSLQALCGDDELDMLAVSLPPGVGKTTLAVFLLTWVAGRDPNNPNLTGSHSNSFVRGVYDECLRIFDPKGEYLWHDVFPTVQVSNTNAKDCRIDLDKRQRFETLEFTSIGTGNAGLYRAANLLYCDDLVSGIEVALSKERLDKLWEIYTTDLRQRKIGDKCKELHIATRWSVHDVIGRLEREYEGNHRAKFIRIPAMNEDDESNFDYEFGVGFSTKFYQEQRDIMDSVSWKALYQNEPVERMGLLYQENELRRYFDLPDQEPDAIIAACDTKDRGTDYCAMPIAYQYGDDYYIEDFICDNSNPEIVEARIVAKLLKHRVQAARFESNSAGGRIAADVQKRVKEEGGRTKITTKFSTTNKETRIIIAAGYAKEHFLFKDESAYKGDKEYRLAMSMLCGYTMAGKNKNDDLVDSIAMLVDYSESFRLAKVEVMKRPF